MKIALTALVACGAATASADVLWDQQPVAQQSTVRNQVIGFDGFDLYLANDASFATDVNVDSVTVYFYTPDGTALAGIGNGGTGVLNIFSGGSFEPDDGSDDPTAGTPVSITFADYGNGVVSATASELDIDLSAGHYWFNLTPTIDFNSFGEGFAAYSSGANGFGSAGYDPSLFFLGWTQPFSPVRDEMALTVNGTAVPAPASAALLGLGGLAAARRRR